MNLSKKLQKLFVMLLVAVMVVSVLPMGSLSVFAVTTEFAGGDGTAENPYLIASKEQLDNVRNYLDANFKLIADIEFTDADFEKGGDFYNNGAGFAPIGSVDLPFSGTFDGDDHVIKNLYVNIESDTDVYAGLFAYNRGKIKKLGIVDGIVSATTTASERSAYAGGIVGYSEGTIENCYNTGNVSADTSDSYSSSYSSAKAGGIAGWNGDDATITNCYNTGDVSASSSDYAYAGGIAGRSDRTIQNCYNTGNVSASSSNYADARAGGIVGYNYDGTITNCYNTGEVSAYASISSDAYAGGIVGNNEGTITNCYNTGDVSASSSRYAADYAYAGGIAGYNYDGTITNCYNTGDVAVTSSSDDAYAGGIVGSNWGSITNCYNTGNVSADASGSDPSARAGGIAGRNDGTIQNCYNTGDVSADASKYAYAGGIAGVNGETITNCYNTGNVSISSSYSAWAGGIAGTNVETITNCYNTGNVSVLSYSGSSKEGGIAGYNGGTITNCYYADNNANGVADGTDTAIKCTEDELKKQETFVGFDFETVWTMESNTTYPYPVLKDVEMIWALNYTIDGDYIFGISAGTKVVQLIYGITEGEYRKVYKDGVELSYSELAGTGVTVKIFEGETMIATYTLVISGDINGDGKIDSTDYLLIKRAAFGTFTLTEAMKLAGDINGDGLIDSVDYLLIKRICFGTYKI